MSRSLSRPSDDADLTTALSQVMTERVQSLAGLRGKIEELAALQQAETERFVSSMRSVFEKSRMSQSAASPAPSHDDEIYRALEKERAERMKAVEIATKFRREGAKVMSEMKQSLKALQDHQSSVEKENQQLRMQLRERSGGGGPAKAGELMALLEEQEKVIEQLQTRRRIAERKLSEVSKERDALRKIEPGVPESLVLEFRQTQSGITEMPNVRLRSLVAALLQRLHAEQAQRLHVEEQAAKIAAAQEEGLRRMEARIKDLESGTRPTEEVPSGGTETTPNLRVPKLTAVRRPHSEVNPPQIPSLESQLQAVSTEFQDSLQQWQQVVSQDAEFMPDSP
uniref:Uncharacterized protein n=1 Tax=Neobodo designis TaxID=312471 RepID=A0A7S1QYI9_NEODS